MADYQSGINFFHRQLSRLYSTLYAMERIREFPWDLFRFFFGQPIFLRLIYLNFYEYAVVSLHKLTNDQTKDVKGSYTLKRFKNTIRKDLVKVKYQKILDRSLHEVKFDPKIEDITKRIKDLRDNLMAHSNRMWLGQTEDLPIQDIPANVRFSELRELTDALEDLYEAVNFQVSADAVPEEYRRRIFNLPSCEFNKYELSQEVDQVLKTFAESSGVWNLPETNPTGLHQLTNEQIERLNSFRVALGKPEISLSQNEIDEINDQRRLFDNPDFRALSKEPS